MTEQSEKEKHRSTAEALRLMTLNWERAETELARVRGLLQRYGSHTPNCESEYFKVGCTCGWGAESADIGKLDSAEEKADV